jgi:hypothetical protein
LIVYILSEYVMHIELKYALPKVPVAVEEGADR